MYASITKSIIPNSSYVASQNYVPNSTFNYVQVMLHHKTIIPNSSYVDSSKFNVMLHHKTWKYLKCDLTLVQY